MMKCTNHESHLLMLSSWRKCREKQNNNTKLEAVLLMYRIWEDDAAIEVAGARIGSALSSQASQGQWPGSSQAETRANCHQAGWAQVVLGSSQPGPSLQWLVNISRSSAPAISWDGDFPCDQMSDNTSDRSFRVKQLRHSDKEINSQHKQKHCLST